MTSMTLEINPSSVRILFIPCVKYLLLQAILPNRARVYSIFFKNNELRCKWENCTLWVDGRGQANKGCFCGKPLFRGGEVLMHRLVW